MVEVPNVSGEPAVSLRWTNAQYTGLLMAQYIANNAYCTLSSISARCMYGVMLFMDGTPSDL